MNKMNLQIISILWRNRKFLSYAIAVSIILSSIVSLLIPPKYKADGIIYPVNLKSLSDETPTDQLMQFLNSYEVKEIIRKKFNLDEHYKINPNDRLALSYYLNNLKENVLFHQTKYGSIEILVYDEHPKMAYDMVYGIIDAVNEHINKSIDEKIIEYNNANKLFMASRRKCMDSIDFLLKDFSDRYGINNYNDKIENAARYYYKSIPEGRSDLLGKKLDELESQGKEEQWKERKTKIWSEQFKLYLGDYNASLQEYDKGVRDVDKKITYTILASKPVLPIAKDSPKRTLIVFLTAIISLIACIIFIVLREKFKEIKVEFSNPDVSSQK